MSNNFLLSTDNRLCFSKVTLWLALLSALIAFLVFSSSSHAQQAYEYDERGRLQKVTYPDSDKIEVAYDPVGTRTEVKTSGTGKEDPDPAREFAIIVVPLNGFTVIPVQ